MEVARKGRDFTMTENFPLGVVIVNYRTADLAIDCLASLAASGAMPDGARVVVVDGGSGDDSASRIEIAIRENDWGSRISLLALPTNGGFAFGNNRGLDHMHAVYGYPDHVLFLNPDTVVRKTALSELLSFMDTMPDAGVAGSRLEDHDETRQACAFRFPSAVADLESEARIGILTRLLRPWSVLPEVGDKPSLVDWVSGASMIVRSEVLRDIGAFDESFFLYYEEVDFCRRASEAGWRCYHVPQSRVVHLVGRATGVTLRHAPLPRRPAYWFESRNRYFIKHHGSVYLAFADMAWMIGHIAYRAKHLLRGRASASHPYLLGDFIRHSFRT